MKQKHSSPRSGDPRLEAYLAERLQLKYFPPRPAPGAVELPETLAAIRRHEARRSGVNDPEIVRQRAAAEIGAYLGAEATAEILRSVPTDCRNLLSEFQPVLSLFLGRRAAERLSTRVIEVAVVRI